MLRSQQPSLAGRGELPACRRLPEGTVAEDTALEAERQRTQEYLPFAAETNGAQ